MRILETAYLILPLLVAGAVHAPVIKKNLLPRLARPLDFGRSFRDARIFGENKTWRGLLLMSTVAVLVVLGQSQLYRLDVFQELSIVDYSRTSWLALGLALGLSYSLAELPNSFVKRRLGIPPGGVSRRRGLVQYVVDQADSAAGGTLALAFFGLAWDALLIVFALGFALHVAMDQLFFLFAVKRRAVLTAAPLEGQPTC
jgi:CDP-diglyceride synthetase